MLKKLFPVVITALEFIKLSPHRCPKICSTYHVACINLSLSAKNKPNRCNTGSHYDLIMTSSHKHPWPSF